MAYSIGDVSRVLGMTTSALHYYEKEGLLKKPMEDSGWRSYEEEDVYRLISVKKYSAMGVSLREIAQQFSRSGMNAEQIVERMKEKRDDAKAMARHYALLAEDIGRLVDAGERASQRDGVVDIRPVGDILLLRPSEGGVIPKNKAEQALARSWLAAQPAVSLGIDGAGLKAVENRLVGQLGKTGAKGAVGVDADRGLGYLFKSLPDVLEGHGNVAEAVKLVTEKVGDQHGLGAQLGEGAAAGGLVALDDGVAAAAAAGEAAFQGEFGGDAADEVGAAAVRDIVQTGVGEGLFDHAGGGGFAVGAGDHHGLDAPGEYAQ